MAALYEQSPIEHSMSPDARQQVEQGGNYEVYQHPTQPRVFAVLGAGAEPGPYQKLGFVQVDLQRTLVPLLAGRDGAAGRLIAHIHGYSNSSPIVARGIAALTRAMRIDSDAASRNCVWVTYDWPGEAALRGPALRRGVVTLGSLLYGLALWVLPLLLLWHFLAPSLHLPPLWLLLTHLLSAGRLTEPTFHLASPLWLLPLLAAVGLFYPLLLVLFALRAVAYHRDRYMALHRGVPDLCEFLRHLDWHCAHRPEGAISVCLHVIAHSMGCLLTLNAVRTLSDLFGRPPGSDPGETLGESLSLGTLVLAAPDVPLELLQVSQNNYFYSALRRFDRMYVFTNVHDAVLRVLSWLANSFAEPQPGNSRYRLGNVFHSEQGPQPPTRMLLLRPWFCNRQVFEPLERASSENQRERLQDLFERVTERVSFIDCSHRPRMGRWLWLFARYPPLRDLLSLITYTWTHSGYFEDPAVLETMRKAVTGELKRGEAGNAVL
jgi:hypothetical protein